MCFVCDVLCDAGWVVIVCGCVRLKHDCVLRVIYCDVGRFVVVCVCLCLCVVVV